MPSHRFIEVATLNTELLRGQPSAWTEAESWLRKAIEEMGYQPEAIDNPGSRRIGYSVPLDSPEMPGPGYDAQTRGAAYDTRPLA